MYLALGSAGSVGPDVTDGRLSGPGPLIRRGSISRQTCRAPIQPAAEWTNSSTPLAPERVSGSASLKTALRQEQDAVPGRAWKPARRRRRAPRARLRPDAIAWVPAPRRACCGRAPSVSTDDRLTHASVHNAEARTSSPVRPLIVHFIVSGLAIPFVGRARTDVLTARVTRGPGAIERGRSRTPAAHPPAARSTRQRRSVPRVGRAAAWPRHGWPGVCERTRASAARLRPGADRRRRA